MGKAIILNDSDFSAYNLGQVTISLVTYRISPTVQKITEATIFKVLDNSGTIVPAVVWSLSDQTKASLTTNQDGSCTVTPLISNNSPVELSAIVYGETLTISFIPTSGSLVWLIDLCTDTPSSGTLANANLANGGWGYIEDFNALLQSNPIGKIKIVPSQAGQINIYKATDYTGTKTLVGSFTVASEDVGKVTTYDITPFTLGATEVLVIGEANSAGGFKYISGAGNGFYSRLTSAKAAADNSDLNISVGYESTESDNELFTRLFALQSESTFTYVSPTSKAISTITTSANSGRVRTKKNVFAKSLIERGLTSVTITCKSGYQICPAGADALSSPTSYNWAWADQVTLDLKNYMCFHIKRADGGTISGTDLSTFIDFSLS